MHLMQQMIDPFGERRGNFRYAEIFSKLQEINGALSAKILVDEIEGDEPKDAGF